MTEATMEAAMTDDDKLISASEAGRARARANKPGTTPQTLLRWEAAGLLKRATTVDGQPVFRLADVIAFCAPSEKDEPATKDEPGS